MSEETKNTEMTVTVPARVIITGQLAAELSSYIQNNPCPNQPVAVALKLCGALEMSLQAAAAAEAQATAGNGAVKPPTEDVVLERAKAEAAKGKPAPE